MPQSLTKKPTESTKTTKAAAKPRAKATGRADSSKKTARKTQGIKIPLGTEVLDEDLLAKQEPDESSLAQAREEWGEIVAEDPLEILEDPSIALELSEDPVRLYLKEIGQIHLLDADSEFRLAARIEALVRVDTLSNHTKPEIGADGHYRALFSPHGRACKKTQSASGIPNARTSP
jgi:RNA polymerase primary sigma factor